MAETVRTIDDFVNASTGLFKDNTAGDISAQDLRDFVWSSQGRNLDDAGTKTASYTATVGAHARVDMNGAGADFTVTFPGSPVVGDRFAYTLARAHATYNLTVARNGSTIYGSTANEALFTTKEAGHTSFWRYESTSSGQGWVRENENKINVQVFTADGTWIKPPGADECKVILVGQGGGGGSGRQGAASSDRVGGGGGSAGASCYYEIPASLFGATEAVNVNGGGQGGAAQASTSNNGNPGTDGEDTTIGDLKALGGDGGAGGTTGATSGGSSRSGRIYSGTGTTSGSGGGSTTSGGSNGGLGTAAPGGGGGGGSIGSANFNADGGNGGLETNASSGIYDAAYTSPAYGTYPGGAGTSGAGSKCLHGLGGAGGAPGDTAGGAAGSGGIGGDYGAGGGGGGASVNGNSSGAGGNGGSGYCLVVTFCK